MQESLSIITEALPDDWVASCGLCGASFAIRFVDCAENPSVNGSFCFDCQASKRSAPGVLNWHRREETTHD